MCTFRNCRATQPRELKLWNRCWKQSTATVFGSLNKTPYSKQASPITRSDLNVGCLTNSLATYLTYCLPWSMKGLKDSPITVFATLSDLAFFPRSRSTSIFVLATFNTLHRNSVLRINSGMPTSSPTAKSKERNASQFHSAGRQSRDTTLRSRRCKKSHIWPHKKNPWSRLGTVDRLKASRYSCTITLNSSRRASK